MSHLSHSHHSPVSPRSSSYSASHKTSNNIPPYMCSTRYLEARMQNPVSYTVTTHSDKCTHHISTSESLEYIPQKQSSKRECCIKTKFYTKKIVAFLLSHVGLASLVVLYTILGGYVFCWLEGSAENNTRIVVLQNRTQLVKELIRLNQYTQAKLLTLFEAHVAKQVSEEYYRVRLKAASGTGGNWPQNLSNISEWKVRSHADREKLTAGLAWYLAGLGWPRNIVPPSWFNNESPPPFEPIADQSYKPDTESTVASLTNATGQAPNLTSHNSTNPFPLDVLEFLPETILGVSTKSIILPLIFNITKEVEFKWEQLVENYTRNLVSAIKDKGWNGADEELGWNSEGSILYAVTIITTIGYGHVTPHTVAGQIMTILYAVVGIPLFFCYLTTSGNYLASLFRGCYVRVCRPACHSMGKGCSRSNGTIKPSRKQSHISFEKRISASSGSTKTSTSHCPGPVSWTYPSPHTKTQVMYGTTLTMDDMVHLQMKRGDACSTQYHCTSRDMAQARCAKREAKNTRRPYMPSSVQSNQQPPSPYLNHRHREWSHRSGSSSSSSSATSTETKSPPPLTDKKVDAPYGDSLYELAILPSSTAESGSQIVLTERKQEWHSVSSEPNKRRIHTSETKPPVVEAEKVAVPISLTLCMMAVYIVVGATVFTFWEEKDFISSSYFCFVTLSTIGFGDIVPGTTVNSQNPKEKMIILALYMAVGLSVFAMCFNLMAEEVINKAKRFGRLVGFLRPEANQSLNQVDGSDDQVGGKRMDRGSGNARLIEIPVELQRIRVVT